LRRVAVTGLGTVSPLGNEPEQLFAALKAGRSGIVRLPEAVHPRLTMRIVAAAQFDGAAHFQTAQLRVLDRVSQFAVYASRQAVADAGLVLDAHEKERSGVFLGTGMGGAQSTDDAYASLYEQGSDRVKPLTVLMAMPNAAASWVGIEHGFSGPNLTFSTACSSSAVAIGEAWRRIAGGETDVMLAGGSEAPLNLGTLKAWDAMKTLATEDADDPAASCKPFALDRSGLVLGEGAAMLVLEEWERAARREARVHGEIVGYGLSTDPAHITRPSVPGQARAMHLALESAGLGAGDIDYINAHGTATLANDAVETAAIKEVFGSSARGTPVSSTKSMHGHLLGAAGALELMACLLALQHATLPPTCNLRVPDPECDLDYVAEGARSQPGLRTVMSNSFAFGGTNAVLICRRP